MTGDSRESGRPEGEHVEISSGSSSVVTPIALDAEDTLSVEYIKITYNGSAGETLTLYDESDGVSAGGLSDKRERFDLAPNERIIIDSAVYDDFEDGVTIQPAGNSDAAIQVTVGGYKVTA